MANIKIRMKDGSIKEFREQGRSGGSYYNRIRYEGVFAIVTDEYGNETVIPANDIAEVNVDAPPRSW